MYSEEFKILYLLGIFMLIVMVIKYVKRVLNTRVPVYLVSLRVCLKLICIIFSFLLSLHFSHSDPSGIVEIKI